MTYVVGVATAIILALVAAVSVQTSRLDAESARFSAFQAEVDALGREAASRAKKRDSDNLRAMEVADAKAKSLLADNAVLGKRLRDARAGGGYVPAPAPGAPSTDPGRVCFDRSELESAIGRLDAGVQGLIGQGDAAKLRLSAGAEWARSIGR